MNYVERSAHWQKDNQQFEALQYFFRRQTGPLHCRIEGRNEVLSRNDARTTYGMIMSFSIGLYPIDLGLPVSFLALTFILIVCKRSWSESRLGGEVGEKNVFLTRRESGKVEAIEGHLLRSLARSRRLPITCQKWGDCTLSSNFDLMRWAWHEDCTSFSFFLSVSVGSLQMVRTDQG